MRTLAFWQLAGTFMTCGFSMSLISSHGVPMLTDHGYAPVLASSVLGILGGSSILTTMMLGAASDRFGRRPVLASIYAGRSLVFAGFFLIRDNPAAIIAVALIGGITIAGTMSMTSALTADIYGRHSVGGILGVIFLAHQVGAATGTWLGGALFDSTGGYGAAFAIAGTVLVTASVVSLHIDDGSRSSAGSRVPPAQEAQEAEKGPSAECGALAWTLNVRDYARVQPRAPPASGTLSLLRAERAHRSLRLAAAQRRDDASRAARPPPHLAGLRGLKAPPARDGALVDAHRRAFAAHAAPPHLDPHEHSCGP